MYTNEIIVQIFERMKGVKIEERRSGSIVVSHPMKDWDLITSLAQNLSFVAERWMLNQEPRTTIYIGTNLETLPLGDKK